MQIHNLAGLYLHIPFCKQACYYCDFHFSTDSQRYAEMADALTKEMALQKGFLKEPLQTIYFGGGTPSLLPHEYMNDLMEAIHSNFSIMADAEITLEANPDDLSSKKVRELMGLGVNRLSIGIQSFDDSILRYLHRAHDSMTAQRSLEEVRKAGINNISIDLMYAIPGLSQQAWMKTVEHAVQFGPQHISCYALTIEDKTAFGNWKRKGKLALVDEESAAVHFEMTMEMMDTAGYKHYEVSNFCRPGLHSRHNSSYWMQAQYLGIGPSAHSYDGTHRYYNVRNNALYTQSIQQGVVPCESEELTRENKINEHILTRLRTAWGCDLAFLLEELNDDLVTRCKTYLQQLRDRELVMVDQHVLRLTRKGMLLADKITEDLMV